MWSHGFLATQEFGLFTFRLFTSRDYSLDPIGLVTLALSALKAANSGLQAKSGTFFTLSLRFIESSFTIAGQGKSAG